MVIYYLRYIVKMIVYIPSCLLELLKLTKNVIVLPLS